VPSTVRVTVPRNNVAERTYSVSVLFKEILGVDVVVDSGEVEHYEVIIDGSRRLVIRDHFFSRFPEAHSYLCEAALPAGAVFCRAPWTPESSLPILFGSGGFTQHNGVLTCDADIFGSAFFFLTRWEEHVIPDRDEHGRVPSRCHFAVANGFHDRPVVNEYAEAMALMLEMVGCPLDRGTREFELVMTHDVDRVYPGLRGSTFLTARPFVSAKRAQRTANYNLTRIDPLSSFRRVMKESEGRNSKSRFYFIAGGGTDKEGYYDLSDPGIRALLEEIDKRGHIIGFHPSYAAADDPHMWQEEKRRLEEATKRKCAEGRQHYLRWGNPATWRLWNDNGMLLDSTMGFSDTVGYRCGTGDSFPVFDILARNVLALRELPLIIMDSAMRRMGRRDRQEALEHIVKVSKRYRMPLTVLFHNHCLDATIWNWADASYAALLDQSSAGVT
jgi:hypothetical protein